MRPGKRPGCPWKRVEVRGASWSLVQASGCSWMLVEPAHRLLLPISCTKCWSLISSFSKHFLCIILRAKMFVVRIPSDGNLPEISRRSYSASASSCQNALQIMGHAQFCIPKFVEICRNLREPNREQGARTVLTRKNLRTKCWRRHIIIILPKFPRSRKLCSDVDRMALQLSACRVSREFNSMKPIQEDAF